MPVTREQAHAIAALAIECRPHGARQWQPAGVIAAIGKVAHLALADVIAASVRAASDRTIDTPAPIGITTSSAWRERLAEPAPTKPVVCETHGIQHTGLCPSCRADELDPRRHDDDTDQAPIASAGPDLCRAIAKDHPMGAGRP